MPNNIGGFVKGFNAPRLANLLSQLIIRRADIKRREARDLQQNLQKQQEFEEESRQIEPLITNKMYDVGLERTDTELEKTGKPLTLANMYDQYKTVEPRLKPVPIERKITPSERLSRLLTLSPEGRARYRDIKESTQEVEGYDEIENLLGLNDPDVMQDIKPGVKERIIRTINANKLMGVKPETTFKDLQGLVYPKPKQIINGPYEQVFVHDDGRQEVVPTEGLNPAYKPTWRESEIPGSIHKDRFGRYVQDVGLYDPNADMWNKDNKNKFRIVKTKPIRITETGTNGEKVFSKEINSHFKRYKSDINSILKAVENNVNPETGIEFTESEKQRYLNKLGNVSSNFAQEVKNTAPPSFLNWYKQLWESSGGNKKAKSNPDKTTYWNELMKAYGRGDLSTKALQSGYNLYLSTYLSNPLLENSLNEEYLFEETEEEEITNDDEE